VDKSYLLPPWTPTIPPSVACSRLHNIATKSKRFKSVRLPRRAMCRLGVSWFSQRYEIRKVLRALRRWILIRFLQLLGTAVLVSTVSYRLLKAKDRADFEDSVRFPKHKKTVDKASRLFTVWTLWSHRQKNAAYFHVDSIDSRRTQSVCQCSRHRLRVDMAPGDHSQLWRWAAESLPGLRHLFSVLL